MAAETTPVPEKPAVKRATISDKKIWIPLATVIVAVICLVIVIPVVIVEKNKHHHPAIQIAISGSETPNDHWTPDRPDPYICEYLGENSCWQPKYATPGSPPYTHDGNWPARSKTCVVPSGNSSSVDDGPAILKAFDDCKVDGHIIFQNTTYHINTVMNTTGLKHVDVEVKGRLVWGTDIDYWLNHSLPIGFQNQSSAWIFGGDDVHFYGHGDGTLDGNGDTWYAYDGGRSNLHGRPHAITIMDTTHSVIEGLRFVQSQMWTMTVARSEKVLLQDIYINNTSSGGQKRHLNTDGCDTLYADDLSFLRWTVDNGDDAIALKQNSTNIYIANSTFYHGPGLAFGSIGQYPGQIEIIANVTVEDIICQDTMYCARLKTWTGQVIGYPPNGGGGGVGYTKNVTMRNFELRNSSVGFGIAQCTNYLRSRPKDDSICDTSFYQVSDIRFINATGTITSPNVATLQCSANAPCSGIDFSNNNVSPVGAAAQSATGYLCSNVKDPIGFQCTDKCKGHCAHI
ncbi:pectin lyase-like protein [Acrodontium crateriforme]|uniref:Pectin lyase-like protein n=1 Tax=Acrodontium crateriforme TaxID=150365 RepID=A0AAQ3LZT1_9PEZI|nr:pectin lyase-like protein [Acrodontium crateriforme]